MASFVFTADPTRYSLDLKAIPGLEVDWWITENYAGDKSIRGGDTVYFFRKKGRKTSGPRLYGWGTVTVDEPVPAGVRESDKTPGRRHIIRVRYMAIAEPPIGAGAVADDKSASTIRPTQGTATRITEEQAAGLDRVLRHAGVNAPADGPEALARRRATPADAEAARNWVDAARGLWGIHEWMLPSETFGSPAMLGSDTCLAAVLSGSDDVADLASYLLPSESDQEPTKDDRSASDARWLSGFSDVPIDDLPTDPNLGEESVLPLLSEDLVELMQWAEEINDVVFGGLRQPLSRLAALLTPIRGEQEHCALNLLRRNGVDLQAARRRLFEDTRSLFEGRGRRDEVAAEETPTPELDVDSVEQMFNAYREQVKRAASVVTDGASPSNASTVTKS